MIAPVTDSDLYEISQIHKSSFSKGWEDGALSEMLKSKGVSGLAARHPEKPIAAFIIYRTVAKESEIITIASIEKMRRKGAGRALMQAFIRECQTNRLEEIFLEVDENNQAAVKLYKSFGFKKVGERQGYYQADKDQNSNTRTNALIMRLDLTV